MSNYINYHCHSHYSNLSTPDVVIKNEDRILRAVQLNQKVTSGVEHGGMGNFFEFIEISKKNNIKPLLGSEVYFVKDRFEKDSRNTHLILLAKNENGRKAINRVISDANLTGYYYKARTDFDLILSLPPNDIWVTTACIGGIWKYEDNQDIFEKLLNHFKENLFLEVQYHHQESQKLLNKKILEMSLKYGVKIIAGMDSHMIQPEQKQIRDVYLASRGVEYPDEQDWFLDFPDYETAFKRFQEQGVLSDKEIFNALENTNIFGDVEEYNSIIFNKDIVKLPTLYPNKSQEEKNELFMNLVWEKWNEEKENVDVELWPKYESEIAKEIETVIATNIADYFLLDYEIIKRGVEKGGHITLTGRGSAPGFYISKLLGFTTIDRISSEIRLFPERFISKERLLETKSLPDIDFNLGNPEVFEEAQNEIMGDGHSYRMISYGKVKTSGAWKLYSRYAGIEFKLSNQISNQIKEYEEDLKYHDGDNEDKPDIKDYIDSKYHEIYNKSLVFIDIVNTLTSHPCGFILFDGNIKEEFGLIKIKTGGKETICACIDGKSAEKYLFLKNDLLEATVVESIHRTYKRIGKKPHSVKELIKICENDNSVWNIYDRGVVMGINQVEPDKTSEKVQRYKPRNISELSSFISAIRPGFKSNYKQYEQRLPFSYGIETLDNIIQTDSFPYSYLLYQELIMAVLAYAGIEIYKTYEIIKSIAKKRYDDIYKYKEVFIPMMTKKLQEDEGQTEEKSAETAEKIWTVIEDSAQYGFNAAHAYSVANDSLYGAYLKSHYPVQFYETLMKLYEEDSDKDRILKAKIEAEKFFNIKFPEFKFGQDNREIKGDEKKTPFI